MIWLDGKIIDFERFPNGETKMNESQIRHHLLNCSSNTHDVTFKYSDDSDLIKLMFLKKYLDLSKVNSDLIIYYMPYSRMDRSEGGSAFTLKYVSNFINSLCFETVTVIEPHSDVTPALLDNCIEGYPTIKLFEEVCKLIEFNKNKDYVYFPDGGAEKRYSKKIKGFKQLVGFKKRDFETGRITNLDVLGIVNEDDYKVIMIDDLCSKGGTFQLGAEKLKQLGASEIYLIVGHCEDTIYEGEVLKSDLINKIYTTDSIITRTDNEKIKIYKLTTIGGLND